MTLEDKILHYQQQYNIVGIVNLDQWHTLPEHKREQWLNNELIKLRQDQFENNQRILITLSAGDIYKTKDSVVGSILTNLQYQLNHVDITNFFVILLTNEPQIEEIKQWFSQHSTDTTDLFVDYFSQPSAPTKQVVTRDVGYRYNSVQPIKISIDDLTEREQFLLMDSKTFCIYPWVHIHAHPTGQTYPCCHAELDHPIGNCKTNTLEEIYFDQPMAQLKENMLNEVASPACARCYEQEESGFFSGRKSANKHHGHHIKHINENKFELSYWDIRFSNLCNLRCRSCGHIFSSQWYQDQVKLAGPEWAKQNTVLNYAGRTETDMWEQLIPHLDYVEQIYFAGGEPLMMEEHYNILEELERRGRFDVRLIYNTNFTHVKLKDRWVFEYWKKFDSVAVGASLDGMGKYAEYIRKGTVWDTVERNREQMLEICPQVDFYISATTSIFNVLHLPDFHRAWVDKGYIKPQDFNINVLQDPAFYRVDIAPATYKQQVNEKYQEHLNWLRPRDQLQRATVGYESVINYMLATDNTHLLDKFWAKTNQLDEIRRENVLEIIPELKALKQ